MGVRAEIYNHLHLQSHSLCHSANYMLKSPEGWKKKWNLCIWLPDLSLPLSQGIPPSHFYHMGLFYVSFCLSLRRAVPPLTTYSLMDGMQSFTEQLKQKCHWETGCRGLFWCVDLLSASHVEFETQRGCFVFYSLFLTTVWAIHQKQQKTTKTWY